MKTDLRRWPGMIRLVAEEIGVDAALRLVDAYGGQLVAIPTSAKGSRLAARAGIDVAALLAEHYGGNSYEVPIMHDTLRAEARRAFVRDNPHLSANECARRLNCTRTRVKQIRREIAQPLPLFDR